MMTLSKFQDKNLYDATTSFFKDELCVKIKEITAEKLSSKDLLSNRYKDDFSIISETYFIGTVDENIFSDEKSNTQQDFEEIKKLATGSKIYEGLMVFAVELSKKPNRTLIAEITRAFNRWCEAMPVAIVFRYENYISFAIPERFLYRQSGRQGERVGKTIILRDINTERPHTGHLRILQDLANHSAKNYNELHAKWLSVLNINVLNKDFYNKLLEWYHRCYADIQIDLVAASRILGKDIDNELRPQSVIRVIIRMMFIWFMKEKGLIKADFFTRQFATVFLKNENTYYNAVLQNMFFAVLNKKIDERRFRKENPKQPFNPQENEHGVFDVMRFKRYFKDGKAEEFLNETKKIPFVNGGLFQCHDYKFTGKDETGELNKKNNYLIDAFSETKPAQVNDNVMFELIDLFNSYVWTIEESTPEEQDIALDPELLGTIFENLIGFYNPETKENARKQTGSFYTPKEIVDYMCRESFKETLKTRFPALSADIDNLVENNEDKLDFPNKNNLLAAITSLKILDPACGSGAFPMGMFNLMVRTIEKLQEHKTTYRNKLDIIQNCIYGIDIQNIAVEISKLRFFISLLVDYPTPNNIADFEALPNLETKFAVANTLIGIDLKKDASMLFDFNAEFRELTEIFMPFTTAKTPSEKTQIKNDFEKKKREIVNNPHSQLDTKSKQMLSAWNPFNVCYCSPFFDSEIMFGINSGFDIVIGNPPYVRKIQLNEKDKVNYDKIYFSAYKQYDIYLFFNELAMKILKNNGICSFIQPNKFLSAEYGYKLCNLLKNNAEIKIIWNVSLENVFDASVYPYVYLFKKKSFDTNFKLEKINLLEHSENLIGFDNFENNNLLIKKIQGKSIFVKDITNSIKRGLANTKINFQDSGKYCGIKSTQIENSYICPNAMIKFDYLSKADEQLKIKEFSKKIFLLPRTVLKIRAVYKNNSDQILDRIYYFENTNKNIDDRFILGILNSKLLTFYYEQIYGSTKIGGGYIDLKGNQIENFPIPSVTSAQQQPLISLVNQILSLKKENKPTTALEREIDRLVYGLYGLTEEEIKIIEGK